MSEIIELHSYYKTAADNNSEEYQEIDLSKLNENYPKSPTEPRSETDFFTQMDIGSKKKRRINKKNSKKRGTWNIIDLITSDIMSDTETLRKNVISFRIFDHENQAYLEKSSRALKMVPVRPRFLDVEYGSKRYKINPILFNTHESTDSKDFVQYVEPYNFNDLVSEYRICETNHAAKYLDISVKDLKFTHHHYFTLEELLAIKLEELYSEYVDIVKTIKELLLNIEVAKRTEESLKEQFLKISPKKKEAIRYDPTIRKYTKIMLDEKGKYLIKLKDKRKLLNSLTSIWLDIKLVREKFNKVRTPYVLKVETTLLNDEENLKKWNDLYESEYSDTLAKLEYEYSGKYLEYRAQKSQMIKDTKQKKITKPKLQINSENLNNSVQNIVDFILSCETDISLHIDKSILKETTNEIAAKNLYFKVYIDNVFVCDSEPFAFGDDSKTNLWESLTVQILPINNMLNIILYENNEQVSSFSINLLERKKGSEFVKKSLIYDKFVAPEPGNVGSGYTIKDICSANRIRLKSSNTFLGNLFTSCNFFIKVTWSDSLNEHQNGTVKEQFDTKTQIERLMHGIDKPNLDILLKIISDIYDCDINDETIIDLLNKMLKYTKLCEDISNVNEHSELIRYKLLILRNNGAFPQLKNKSIPLQSNQVSTEQLNCLQISEEKDEDIEYMERKRDEMDPIDIHRYIGIRFVNKLNQKISKDLNEHLLRKTYKDVVMDFKDLSIRSIFTNKSDIRLSQSCGVTFKQQIEERLKVEQNIQVTIVRAFNLLDRTVEVLGNEAEDNIAGFKVRALRPFVRVSYRGESVQSPVAVGSHPTWNYTATINTKLEPSSCIHFNIYDEYKVNISTAEDVTRQTSHYRSYNRWLGTLSVPMHAVLELGTLRGTFKLTTPPQIFGYECSNIEPTTIIPEIIRLMRKDSAFLTLQIKTSLSEFGGCQVYNQPALNSDHIIKHLNEFVTAYLNDFPDRNISLTFIDSTGRNKCVTEFIQPISMPGWENFPRDPKRIESASRSSILSKSSSRKASPLDVETNPFEIEQATEEVSVDRMIEFAVRYVSLIPTYELADPHVVSLKGIELLKVAYGSPLDHSLLLASYFLQLGIRTWVLVGAGLPRGLSSYVLVKYRNNNIIMAGDDDSGGAWFSRKDDVIMFVYDAVVGERHEVRDVACPLKTVHYAFDCENIWVNAQTSLNCENISFEFNKSTHWLSVFNKSVYMVNEAAIICDNRPTTDVENIRNHLETRIKAKVQKWRWNVKTIWNRYVSSLLRDTLSNWEHWSFNPHESKPSPGQRLKHLMLSYKMYGFPLNMPYVNTRAVVSRVKSTMLHVNDDPTVEFALAVELYAYPNDVISVWVYLATITKIII